MGTWTTNPSQGVIINGSNITFPENNTNANIPYTVTYTDDNGCTVSTTYTVNKCEVEPCACSSVTCSTTNMEFGYEANVTKTFQFSTSCTDNLTITGPSWLNISSEGTNTITVSVTTRSVNTGTIRTEKIAIKVNGVTCNEISVTQYTVNVNVPIDIIANIAIPTGNAYKISFNSLKNTGLYFNSTQGNDSIAISDDIFSNNVCPNPQDIYQVTKNNIYLRGQLSHSINAYTGITFTSNTLVFNVVSGSSCNNNYSIHTGQTTPTAMYLKFTGIGSQIRGEGTLRAQQVDFTADISSVVAIDPYILYKLEKITLTYDVYPT